MLRMKGYWRSNVVTLKNILTNQLLIISQLLPNINLFQLQFVIFHPHKFGTKPALVINICFNAYLKYLILPCLIRRTILNPTILPVS